MTDQEIADKIIEFLANHPGWVEDSMLAQYVEVDFKVFDRVAKKLRMEYAVRHKYEFDGERCWDFYMAINPLERLARL